MKKDPPDLDALAHPLARAIRKDLAAGNTGSLRATLVENAARIADILDGRPLAAALDQAILRLELIAAYDGSELVQEPIPMLAKDGARRAREAFEAIKPDHRADINEENFRETAANAIKSYFEKGALVDALVWGRIVGFYEAHTTFFDQMRATLDAEPGDSAVELVERVVAMRRVLAARRAKVGEMIVKLHAAGDHSECPPGHA